MSGALDPLAAFRLDGRVVVLTGASAGLGERFARVLDSLGATTVLAARRKDRLDALVGELVHAEAVVCDVGVEGANEALIDEVVERHGKIDVVIANAGLSTVSTATRESVSDYLQVLQIDLVAPFALARAAQPAMRAAGGGSIVMVSSAAGFKSLGLLPQAGYVAAKTRLIGLTRELAFQWARYNIRVNALCPGAFPSELTSAMIENDDLRATFESLIPLHRIGRTDELDGAMAFLASSASSYMTGQTLVVDGGYIC